MNIIFIYLSGPFIMRNFQKLLKWIQKFDGRSGQFALKENSFRKITTMISMYLWVPFIVQNFKKYPKNRYKVIRACRF